jgi:hypothetical protein
MEQCSYKHKRCKIWTIKIKIMTRRNNVVTNTRDAKIGPLRSRSWRPRRSLATIAKREEKEDNDQHEDHKCRNPSFGLATKAKACEGASQEWSLGVTFHAHGSVGECEGMNPPYFQVNSHFGSWSLDGLPNLQRAISGVKVYYIEEVFIPLKRSWNLNV